MTTPTLTTAPLTLTLDDALAAFLRALDGRNRSAGTVRAYRTDVSQFTAWLSENNITVHGPADVTRADLTEYLAHLARRGVSGVSRARKLAAIREFFRHLVDHGQLASSPAQGVETPKREKHSRTYLRPDEYTRLLALAGASPRDFAILQTFLQTGVRVSELCGLTLDDIDLPGRVLHVRGGKGLVDRTIELERKGVQALKSYLAIRPAALSDRLFLNRYGEPLSERGVRKLLAGYCRKAGITKQVSPHSLRHTFGTYKARRVPLRQVQEWLGHADIRTTQIYVHLDRENARRDMEGSSL